MPLMVLYFSVAGQSQIFWTHFLWLGHVYYFVTLRLQLTVMCFEGHTLVTWLDMLLFFGCYYNCWNRLYNNDITVVLQYSKTNEMHFLYSIYYESAASTCFEHYLLIFSRRCTNNNWYIVCVLCLLAATRVGVEPVLLQPW
jgi:hypothetical protein